MGDRGTICCCVITTIIVLGGIAVLIAYMADGPRSPSFTIDEATLTGYNLTADNHLTATFFLSIRSHNRDTKYSVEYKAMAVVVYFNDFGLAYEQNTIGVPMKLAHGDDVIFKARPTAQNVMIPMGDVAGELRNQTKVGPLKLEVRIRASVRFSVKHWKHRNFILKVICSPMIVDLATGKTFEETICNVDRFSSF